VDPGLLVIILFIVAPLLERLLKGTKQPPEPPPRQRPHRPPQQRPVPGPRPGQQRLPQPQGQRPAPTTESGENAVDILPEDLLAILTGQKPMPRPTLPEPVRLPPRERPAPLPTARPERGHSYDEEEIAEPTHLPAPYSSDDYVPLHEPPKVVSLEELEIDDEVRHDAFHERLEALPAPAQGKRHRRPAAHRFTSDDDLRHAIVMAEVLGKPKGLE
jgi:hypothetical protein